MKNLLNEIKAMNKIAGTELTKKQEIAIIRERLEQLNELEFGTQKSFDAYNKQHDLRGDTKVTVAGKKMSVSQAAKQSKPAAGKGGSVFGKGKGGSVFGGDKSTSTDTREKKVSDMVNAELKKSVATFKKGGKSADKFISHPELHSMLGPLKDDVKAGRVDQKEAQTALDNFVDKGDYKPLGKMITKSFMDKYGQSNDKPAPKLHKIYDKKDQDELTKGAKKMGFELRKHKTGTGVSFMKNGKTVASMEKRNTEGMYGPQGTGAKNDYRIVTKDGDETAQFSMKDAIKWLDNKEYLYKN